MVPEPSGEDGRACILSILWAREKEAGGPLTVSLGDRLRYAPACAGDTAEAQEARAPPSDQSSRFWNSPEKGL